MMERERQKTAFDLFFLSNRKRRPFGSISYRKEEPAGDMMPTSKYWSEDGIATRLMVNYNPVRERAVASCFLAFGQTLERGALLGDSGGQAPLRPLW
jgi:hypothetical protein